MYRITELPQAKQDFRAVFNTGLGSLLEDGMLMSAIGQLVVDIVKFNAFLEKAHPDSADLSIDIIVRKHYGAAGIELLNKLTL